MVYRPGRGKWEPLPNIPQSREKHRMVAFNWNVYVIGGREQVFLEKEVSVDVMVYNIKTERWVIRGRLLLPVEDCAAAVLGHRIYVFGGCGQVVQCMDTLTDQVYVAGRLPSLSYGHRAICDGGTVYVVTQGEVLKMKENYAFADERELQTKTQDGGPLEDDTSESAQTSGDAFSDPSPTVRFEIVGTFPFRRCDFGVYLNGGELVVCGGRKDVDILHDQLALDLKTGKMTHKQQTLMYGRAEFHAHLLYVPDEFLSESESISQGIIRFSFFPSVLTDVKSLTSKQTTIGPSKWHVLVTSKPGYVGIFLCWTRGGSKKKILACCTMKLVPSVEKVDAISRNIGHTFTEEKDGRGYSEFAKMDDLTGENSPYLHDGKIMVELNINSLR